MRSLAYASGPSLRARVATSVALAALALPPVVAAPVLIPASPARAEEPTLCTLDLAAVIPDARYRVGVYAWTPHTPVTLLRGVAETRATAERAFRVAVLEAEPGARLPERAFLLFVSPYAAVASRPDACRAALIGERGGVSWTDAVLTRVGTGFSLRVRREGSSSRLSPSSRKPAHDAPSSPSEPSPAQTTDRSEIVLLFAR